MGMRTRQGIYQPSAAVVSDRRDYWVLLKPNVMSLVVFSGAVGLFLAPGTLHPLLMLTALLAIAAGAGASAAINNGYDHDIDRLMPRTAKRPTAVGRIAPEEALGLGVTLAIISVMVMGLGVNWVAAALLALTIAFYVFRSSSCGRRRTSGPWRSIARTTTPASGCRCCRWSPATTARAGTSWPTRWRCCR
jgi:protoheme IX farnesyltransferase